MVYHIYWGTSGNSGLYLDEIYKTIESIGLRQKVFVNYYYPFSYGEKVFFKRSDIAFGNVKGTARKLIQFFEVLKAYFIIFLQAVVDKPEIINYSHVGSSYFFIPLYLSILKKITGAKLIITCHDVVPHSGGASEFKYRKSIFHLADFLLVHTDNSITELVTLFNIDKGKIVKHLFPIMDLSKLPDNTKHTFKESDFLFIGHLRKDKGIEFLLTVWYDFNKIYPEATLRICGKKQSDVFFDELSLSAANVEFNVRFIDDDEYKQYIKSSRYVILPYMNGTNSGIISTVLSLGAEVITSDIPMFLENPLVRHNDRFKVGDKQSLIKLLSVKYTHHNITEDNKRLNIYREQFRQEVIDVYNKLINHK